VAERRLADGTVEGESLYVRPDGVPIKVHYFADKEGQSVLWGTLRQCL